MDTCSSAEVCIKVNRTGFSLAVDEVLENLNLLLKQYIFDGLLYDSALEANTDLLDAMPIDEIIGNASNTLKLCKTTPSMVSKLRELNIPIPEVCATLSYHETGAWLRKDLNSTGGFGVSHFHNEDSLPANSYLQRKLDGLNFSLTFIANENDILPLGFNTTWSRNLSNSIPFAYAGAINTVDITEAQKTIAIQYAEILTSEFKLIGLNSIDYMLSDDCVYVLEINPRVPATFELYENKNGDLIRHHIEACKTKIIKPMKRVGLLRAHAIVYSPKTIIIPTSFSWPLWTADRPHKGEVIGQHHPLCSIFAGGQNEAQIKNMIRARESILIKKLIQANQK